jgi:hypothetical protein
MITEKPVDMGEHPPETMLAYGQNSLDKNQHPRLAPLLG